MIYNPNQIFNHHINNQTLPKIWGRWPTHPRENLRAWPSPSPTSTENGVFIAFVNRAMTWQTLPMQIAESAAIAVVS